MSFIQRPVTIADEVFYYAVRLRFVCPGALPTSL